jgi:hypothetical protein
MRKLSRPQYTTPTALIAEYIGWPPPWVHRSLVAATAGVTTRDPADETSHGPGRSPNVICSSQIVKFARAQACRQSGAPGNAGHNDGAITAPKVVIPSRQPDVLADDNGVGSRDQISVAH